MMAGTAAAAPTLAGHAAKAASGVRCGPTDAEKQQARERGINTARRRCGPWPIAGTNDELLEALARTRREIDFADRLLRWSGPHRFRTDAKTHALGLITFSWRYGETQRFHKMRLDRFDSGVIASAKGNA
jgi:hypothetical protein